MDESTVNVMTIGGSSFLLVEGGEVVHVAATDESPGAVAALDDVFLSGDYPLEPTAARYNWDELSERRWSSRTLCGREWFSMAATDLGPLRRWQEPAYSPTCKACMRSVDRLFPQVQPHEGLDLVVEMAARAVHSHGSAAIDGVPGPQIESLRRAVRARLRSDGFRSQTVVADATVHIFSDDAYRAIDPQIRAERDRAVARVIDDALSGVERQPVDTSEWRFNWSTWAV